MYLVFIVAIILVIYGLWLDFAPKKKYPEGNVTIYLDHWWNTTNDWWNINMHNCYGMQPHDWNRKYKAKGEKKIRYHDTGICTKCGKRWSFSSH